jgi:predicted Zn-dependent protease with MMP-like domain
MINVDLETFEKIVERVFQQLPDRFRDALENLAVFTEEYPTEEIVQHMHLPSKYNLLGLYQGIPLTKRGVWYGTTPVAPDKISLYKNNILSRCRDERDLEVQIYEVLVHEIGHYFGMSEDEIRSAGF